MLERTERSVGGVRWQVVPQHCDELIGPHGLRLEEWLAAGRARVVKHGPHRTVYRVQLPGLDFHLKHNRLAGLRSWLRGLIRPSKARIEHERARAVAARGIATVEPLALGEPDTPFGACDSFLITRTLDGTVQLDRFIEQTMSTWPTARQTSLRQRLAVELGRLLARMHGQGIRHGDLHPGNLLLRLDENDEPTFSLIDLNAVRIGRVPGWPARRENLVLLNHWFSLRVGRADRLRFWRAYCEASEKDAQRWLHAVDAKAFAKELERRTWESNLDFWRHRDRRCLGTNRYYRRLAGPEVCGHAVCDLDPAMLEPWLHDPDAPFRRPGVRLLKDSRSSTVAEFDLTLAGETRRVIYKRFRIRTRAEPWVARVRRTAALRSWVFGQGLRDRWLPTPRPLAVLHRRRRGLFYEGYLLTEMIPDAVELHRYLAHLADLPAQDRRRLLRQHIDQVARLVRELHRRQLSHRDLKAANILVERNADRAVAETRPGATGPVWLIDLVGVQRHRKLGRPRKVQNLARLNASFLQSTQVTRADRLRFLRVYLQWGLTGRQGWKRWWREVAVATGAKAARNARTGRPLA